jgi:hypothetical protein
MVLPRGRRCLVACAVLVLLGCALAGGLWWYVTTYCCPAPVVRPAAAESENTPTDPF